MTGARMIRRRLAGGAIAASVALTAVLPGTTAAAAPGPRISAAIPDTTRTTTPAADPSPGTSSAVPSPAGTGNHRGGAALDRPGIVVDRPAGVPAPPAFPAGAYLVADLDTGAVILASNAHLRARPASTIKVLTALTLVERLAPTATVTSAPEDVSVDGTKVGMTPGQPYQVQQLFQAMLMSSANDAATALARANGGSPQTAAQMTQVAHALGAVDTTAQNPTGLDATGQLTTVYDMALLGRAALRNGRIAQVVTTRRAQFPAGPAPRGPRGTFELDNHNRLLYNYAGTIGVKNGYTVASRQTFIGAARRGSKAYVVTFLGGTDGSWRPTAALLDWAFANGTKVRPIGTLDDPAASGATNGQGSQGAGSGDLPTSVADAPRAVASATGSALDRLTSGPPAVLGAVVAALAAAVVALRVRAVRRRRTRRRARGPRAGR